MQYRSAIQCAHLVLDLVAKSKKYIRELFDAPDVRSARRRAPSVPREPRRKGGAVKRVWGLGEGRGAPPRDGRLLTARPTPSTRRARAERGGVAEAPRRRLRVHRRPARKLHAGREAACPPEPRAARGGRGGGGGGDGRGEEGQLDIPVLSCSAAEEPHTPRGAPGERARSGAAPYRVRAPVRRRLILAPAAKIGEARARHSKGARIEEVRRRRSTGQHGAAGRCGLSGAPPAWTPTTPTPLSITTPNGQAGSCTYHTHDRGTAVRPPRTANLVPALLHRGFAVPRSPGSVVSPRSPFRGPTYPFLLFASD